MSAKQIMVDLIPKSSPPITLSASPSYKDVIGEPLTYLDDPLVVLGLLLVEAGPRILVCHTVSVGVWLGRDLVGIRLVGGRSGHSTLFYSVNFTQSRIVVKK